MKAKNKVLAIVLSFVMMLAMVGTLAHVCAFLTLQLLVESRVLRIAGALAVAFPILGMRGGYYWQVWPHRVVFPMILLLYGAVILKKNYRGFISTAGEDRKASYKYSSTCYRNCV